MSNPLNRDAYGLKEIKLKKDIWDIKYFFRPRMNFLGFFLCILNIFSFFFALSEKVCIFAASL